LITDKTRAETPHREVIARLANEVRQVRRARPDIRLVLGHGSGSFGHWHAKKYGTRDGVRGRDAWIGFARVAASAARLNGIVVDILLSSGVPVLGVRPSASARCRDGMLLELNTALIHRALEEGLVPLVHGDVALDEVRGGTIISTEEILVFLADEMGPSRILLVGGTPGVLSGAVSDGGGGVVPLITPGTIEAVAYSLGESHAPDVTGGMMSKVQQMLDLVRRRPDLVVHILSGHEPGLLVRALSDPNLPVGTRLRV
jgi:isopentenyl phosphate kinase